VSHLKKQRAIPKSITALDTFATTVAEFFIYSVLVIWGLDKCADDGTGGTDLVFCTGVDVSRFGTKEAEAYLAVPAHGVCVDTFDG
jgi:hypothetical protein